MADETTVETTDGAKPATQTIEIVHKQEGYKAQPDNRREDNAEWDSGRFLRFYDAHKDDVDKTLGLTELRTQAAEGSKWRAEYEMKEAETEARDVHGLSADEVKELRDTIPDVTPASLLAAASIAGKYKAAAREIEETNASRGILAGERAPVKREAPPAGTRERMIYDMQVKTGVIKG